MMEDEPNSTLFSAVCKASKEFVRKAFQKIKMKTVGEQVPSHLERT
jgi:hypothetical protein